MTIPYYNEKRGVYLFPQGPKVFIGKGMSRDDFTKVEYADLSGLSKADYKSKTLWIWESRDEIPDAADLLARFPDLENLALSRDLIPFKKNGLDGLKSLYISGFRNGNPANRHENHLWLKEQIMPCVEFFKYLDRSHFADFAGLQPENLPNLKWIECDVDNKKDMLKLMEKFESVTALSVEILCINGYRQELDLGLLSGLQLKEIQLLNCPKITNAEALLEMESLESLFVLSCKNALSAELKLKLKEREFAHLDVDFT